MPGVHAVLTHEDVPGSKTYGLEFPDQPVLAIDRVRYYGEPVALVAAEHPEQARRAAEAIVVEYEPLELVVDPERATEQEPLHPDRPTMGHGYRDDPRPNVVRSIVIRHGDPDVEGDVTVEGVYELGSQDQAFLGPESGIAIPGRRGRHRHPRRDAVAPRRPRPDRPLPRAHERAGAGAPRRRRRRVRRPRGPLDPDPRRDAGAPRRPAGEDRLQPRGVVHRPRPPAPRQDLGRASRDPRRPRRLRPHADPGRRRRLCLELDGGDLERLRLRDRPVPRRQRPDRGHGGLYEQSAVRRDARLRRRAGVLRRRGADGPAGRGARHRPDRAPPAERDRERRHAPDGTGPDGLAARRRGHPRRRRDSRARGRGAAARPDPASRRRRQHDAGRRRPAGRRVRGRLQEHLLLGGVRRLLRRARADPRRRERHRPLRRRRGGPGARRRDPPGRRGRARDERDHARDEHDEHRRLGRIDLRLAHDLDGRRRRSRCLPRRGRGARASARAARSTSSGSTATPRPSRSIPRPARCWASARTSRSRRARCASSPRSTSISA